jgi:hypothetical protein
MVVSWDQLDQLGRQELLGLLDQVVLQDKMAYRDLLGPKVFRDQLVLVVLLVIQDLLDRKAIRDQMVRPDHRV